MSLKNLSLEIMKRKTEEIVKEVCRKVFSLPENITVKEWADKYRTLSKESASEFGQWDTARTKYMLEIYEKLTNDEVREIALMFAAQLAKSEFILNVFGWYAHLDPCPMMIVQPTEKLANEFSKERLDPLIRDCAPLKKIIKDATLKNSGNTVSHKRFIGGFVSLKGAQSPANLASKPIKVLFMDETDRYKVASGKEGDPVELAKKRTQTFSDSKIILTSTPVIKGESKIEAEFLAGSQARYYYDCPSCKEGNLLTIDKMVYETKITDEKNIERIKMRCEFCGSLHSEIEWKTQDQRWIHSHPERVDKLSYTLNGFSGVFRTWKDIMEEYIKVKDNTEKYKTFVNTVLCETWEDLPEEEQDWEELMGRTEEYEAEVPEGVLLLTAGTDTQDDRFVVEVLGHGLNGETWGIEYKIIYGNMEKPRIWEELDEFLKSKYHYKCGTPLYIHASCIDTGGHHTQSVYDFVSPRAKRRVCGIKGIGGDKKIIHSRRQTPCKKIMLYSIGVNALKDRVMTRLKIEKPEGYTGENIPGYCHYPNDISRGFDEAYFKSLTAEVKIIDRSGKSKQSKVIWKQIRDRNEGLDCRNYAIAAREIFARLSLNQLSTMTKEELSLISRGINISEAKETVKFKNQKGIEI